MSKAGQKHPIGHCSSCGSRLKLRVTDGGCFPHICNGGEYCSTERPREEMNLPELPAEWGKINGGGPFHCAGCEFRDKEIKALRARLEAFELSALSQFGGREGLRRAAIRLSE